MKLLWDVNDEGFIFSSEDGLCPKLEELYAAGKAVNLGDNRYLVQHKHIAALNKNERELLDLPRIFPYRLRIAVRGNIAFRDFKYFVEYMQPNGQAFLSPKVIGSFVELNEEQRYTFSNNQFIITSIIMESNRRLLDTKDEFDIRQYNCSNFAKIKKAATNINAEVNLFIKNNNVVVPKKLSVMSSTQKNGDLLVDPVILDEDGEAISSCNDFANVFNERRQVKNLYAGKEGFYLIEPEIEEALKEVKANRVIPKENALMFIRRPGTVFSSPAFDFNIDDYSERVIDIGEYKYKSESNGKSGISWLPPEGTSFDSDNDKKPFEVTIDNVDEINRLIKEAQANGATFIVFNERTLLITAKLLADVERMLELTKGDAAFDDNNATDTRGDFGDDSKNKSNSGETSSELFDDIVKTSKKKGKKILLIADNFADVEYKVAADRVQIIDDIALNECLNSGIHLLKHQKDGLQWLLRCYAEHKGALLADDMGLGKTLQTLAFAAIAKKYMPQYLKKSILIVAPVSLLKNWEEEYFKFVANGLFKEIIIIDNSSVKKYYSNNCYDFQNLANDHIVLTSYETLRTYQFAFGKIDWSLMVLDEAQRIKNPTALITIAIKAMKYDFGLCLTGTPIENTWVDLWSIMDFVAPGYHLGCLKDFKNNYVNKIKNDNHNTVLIKELGQKLHADLEPLFMRRLKKTLSAEGNLPELPKKIIIKREEIMPPSQRLAYESLVSQYLVGDIDKNRALQLIAKLRDISLFPDIGTIDERRIDVNDARRIFNSSARLKVTFSELVNIYNKNEKVLIFVESKKMQRILRTVIAKLFKIHVPIPINGDMRGDIRQEIVDEFNSLEGFGVLLLSPLAAGVGLNIVTANHVIHLSRHWNPAKEDQATDRAYRIGQKRDVEVVIPMSIHPALGEGSFDQKLDMLLDYKRQLSEDALFPTADSAEDGLSLFEEIAKGSNISTNLEKPCYDIESVDDVDGTTFEMIVTSLYSNQGMEANKTVDSNDNGADVIVFGTEDCDNLLIQCKKTKDYSKNLGKNGIQEIVAALKAYEELHRCKFKPVVITNALDFTSGARELAMVNNVELICRDKLIKMLEMYPVEKFYI